MKAAEIRILMIMSLQYLICLYEVIGAALRSLGKSLVPALLTVIGCVGLRVLWILTVFRAYHHLYALMAVYPVSWVVTASLTIGVTVQVP